LIHFYKRIILVYVVTIAAADVEELKSLVSRIYLHTWHET